MPPQANRQPSPSNGPNPDFVRSLGQNDPSGNYDFGPRVGKVTNLMVNGRPATREEALQVLQQSAGLAEGMIEEEQSRQKGIADFAKSQEPDEYMRNVLRDLAPMAAFPLLSRTGFLRGAAGAAGAGAIGGQAGEVIDRLSGDNPPSNNFKDWLGRRAGDAAMGAGTEIGGRAIGSVMRGAAKPARTVLGGAMQDAPGTLREEVAGKYGIHFTPSQVMDEYSTATGKPKGLLMRGEESRAFHNPYSRSIAQSGARERNRASRATVTGLVNSLGPEVPANITGARVASAIESGGKPAYARQVEKLKSVVNARAFKTQVDVTSLKQEAQSELQAIGEDLINRGQFDETVISDAMGEPTGEVVRRPRFPNNAKIKMLREIEGFPDQMPFTTLMGKRTEWMSVSPQITELISGEAKGTAKHYTQLSTDLLDKAAKGPGYKGVERRDPTTRFSREAEFRAELNRETDPAKRAELEQAIQYEREFRGPGDRRSKTTGGGFEQDWNRFRNFTRKGADVFESQTITDAVNKNPEEIVKLVKGDDITDALRIRRAIKGYAEMFGSPADKLKAASAWKKFQISYLRENVLSPLDGNMNQLQDSLDKLSPAVKRTIFDDPESQSVLTRLTQVGKALKDADKNLGVLMGHQDPLQNLDTTKGWIRSMRPWIVSKIAWSPSATRFFLRGLAGLAEASPTDSAIKDFVSQTLVGKGSKAALKAGGYLNNRRLGAAMANIIRAYDLVNIHEEAKAREAQADKVFKDAIKYTQGGMAQ